MAFDNHEFRRKHIKDSLLALEDRKEKLEDEIRQIQKPSTNRMLAESLGTSNKGYRFQQMLLVLVQHGEVVTYQTIGEVPHIMQELTEKHMRDNGIYKIGDAFYEKRRSYRFDKVLDGLENIKRYD